MLQVTKLVHAALSAGFRMLDTADLYYNHRALAAALAISLPALGLTRWLLLCYSHTTPTP